MRNELKKKSGSKTDAYVFYFRKSKTYQAECLFLCDVDYYPVDLSGKMVVSFRIVIGDIRFIVYAHIDTFIRLRGLLGHRLLLDLAAFGL